MEINDIVKVLNQFHETVSKDGSFYVLHREVLNCEVCNAYKRHTWTLWFMQPEQDKKNVACIVQLTARAVNETEKKYIEVSMTHKMLGEIYRIIHDKAISRNNGDTERGTGEQGSYRD